MFALSVSALSVSALSGFSRARLAHLCPPPPRRRASRLTRAVSRRPPHCARARAARAGARTPHERERGAVAGHVAVSLRRACGPRALGALTRRGPSPQAPGSAREDRERDTAPTSATRRSQPLRARGLMRAIYSYPVSGGDMGYDHPCPWSNANTEARATPSATPRNGLPRKAPPPHGCRAARAPGCAHAPTPPRPPASPSCPLPCTPPALYRVPLLPPDP